MAEKAFASVWGLSYSDFKFFHRYGTKSRVMIACQLPYFGSICIKVPKVLQELLHSFDVTCFSAILFLPNWMLF